MFSPKAQGETPFFPLPVSSSYTVPWLVAATLESLRPSSHGFSPAVCVCIFLCVTPCVIGFRAHSGNPG